MYTSLLLKTMMYPAAANLAVLRRELDSMAEMMWTSFARWTLCASSLMVAAAVPVPSGS